MALKLGELVTILSGDKKPLEKELAEAKVETRAAGQAMQREHRKSALASALEWARAGEQAGAAFTRDAAGRLRDSRGKFVREGQEAGSGFSGAFGTGLGAAEGMFSRLLAIAGQGRRAFGGWIDGVQNLAGQLQNATGVVGKVVGWLVSAARWISLVGSAASGTASLVGVLAAALGSLPTALSGLAALTGTLSLGFMGLGDAFKQVSGGGGGGGKSVVDTAYQIVQAQRRLRDANEEATDSTTELGRARKTLKEATADLARAERDARENLDDLSRSVRGAKLDEAEATVRLVEAQMAYRETLRTTRDPIALEKARLALEQAQLATEDARDTTKDLSAEQVAAAKKGVKGSDEVRAAQEQQQAAVDQLTSAIRRQRAAVEGVEDAEHALAQARQSGAAGGGGGAAQELVKLAPAAQHLVDVIKKLKPAFEDLRLGVQQRLFAGVGDKVKLLAEKWFPQLKRTLGSYADTLNRIAKTAMDSASKPTFISNMAAGAESVRRLLDKVGKAVSGPLLDAFGRLSRAASPFIDKIGDKLAGIIGKFSALIKKADDSKKLTKFFRDAADLLGKIWDLGENVIKVVGQIIGILWPQSKDSSGSALDSANKALESLSKWLDDPKHQKTLRDTIANVEKIAKKLWAVGVVGAKVFAAISGAGIKAFNWIMDKGHKFTVWVDNLRAKIRSANLFDGIKDSFRNAFNWVIDRWNNLSFGLPSVNIPFLGQVGGGRLDTPNIHRLAAGGLVKARPGGILANIGEGGKDEVVSPVDKLAAIIRDALGDLRMVLEIRSSGEPVDDFLVDRVRAGVKRRGGNVQVVLGQK